MRSSLLTSAALACAALFVVCGARAVPINVGLLAAAGSHSWTSPIIADPHGTLSLSAWEYDSGAWTEALMTYVDAGPGESGLGVECNQMPPDNACSQNQTGSVPWQMIDMDISALTGWTSLAITLDSVDPGSTGYVLGASCGVGGSCTSVPLSTCTNTNPMAGQPITCLFNLGDSALGDITDLWLTPSDVDPNGNSVGNLLLDGSVTLYAVPEPAVLGSFGFGLLLMGGFVGLRRRGIH